MQSILLRHLEAHAHAIVVIHNAAHGTHRSAAGKIQLAQGFDQGEQLLLLEEQADAIGGAGGKTRSTQQQALQLDGMRLLIEGIGAVPCLAVNLGCKGAIGLEGKVGIALAEAELIVVRAQILLNLASSNLAASLCQQVL